MDSRILDALRGSIAKWQAIVDGTGRDNYATNCPLCQLSGTIFEERQAVQYTLPDYEREEIDTCVGCPVFEDTGRSDCQATPYEAWSRHQTEHMEDWADHSSPRDFKRDVKCDTCRELALAERDYLISLLPEGELP